MTKLSMAKSKLSIDKAPITKKQEKPIKLGLKSKASRKMRSYKLRVETIEVLSELTKEANKHSNLQLSNTDLIELLILEASKRHIKDIVDLINT